MSTRAISCWFVHSCIFHTPIFDRAALSTPANSISPLNRQVCSPRYSFRIPQLHILPMTGLFLIFQSYTFMSYIFNLPHEHAFQRILMHFLFVIKCGTTSPRNKWDTDKSTLWQNPPRIPVPCGQYGLWPIWYRAVRAMKLSWSWKHFSFHVPNGEWNVCVIYNHKLSTHFLCHLSL